MNRWTGSILLPALVMMMALTSVALADPADKPIPQERQTNLLDRFGDQGIDTDGDGSLTHDEVRAFFADKHPGHQGGGHGMKGHGRDCKEGHGMKGHGRDGKKCPGAHGKMGRGGGPGDHSSRMLEHLEKLSADAAPADFDLTRFPDADSDGDGQLSEAEWATFSEQARQRLLAHVAVRFPDADADGDGTLNAEELVGLKATIRQHCLDRNPEADTDGDGVLSDEESTAFRADRAQQHGARMLERHPEADLDGDGTISEDEARAFRKDRPGRRGPKHGGWQSHDQRPTDPSML